MNDKAPILLLKFLFILLAINLVWANRIVLSNNFSHGLPLLFSDSGHLHLHPNSRACSDDD
jgi:hypothetical protein